MIRRLVAAVATFSVGAALLAALGAPAGAEQNAPQPPPPPQTQNNRAEEPAPPPPVAKKRPPSRARKFLPVQDFGGY
jgi:hypothetical protein